MYSGFTGSLWKAAARMQLEAIGFAASRTQAYLELPVALSACRGPDDLIRVQSEFMENAQRAYIGGLEAAFSAIPLPPLDLTGGKGPVRRARDYMSVPDPVAGAGLNEGSGAGTSRPAISQPTQPLRRSA